MKIGFIGLGRMGMNLVLHLLEQGQHQVVAYNRHPDKVRKAAKNGAIPAYSVEELVQKLPNRKIIWLMLPAGKPVQDTITALIPLLKKGDIIIDGGNSWFQDSQKRYRQLKNKGIHFLDCGTSGGIPGARHGACFMVGGDRQTFKTAEPILKQLSVPHGYGYFGKPGAGHFVKMVHNGIEYGMAGAITEGVEALKKYEKHFGFTTKEAVRVYAHGSIIQSKMMGWLWQAYATPGFMEKVSCEVPLGETEEEMKKLERLAPMSILHQARMQRQESRNNKYCAQAVAVMRNLWGKHEVKEIDDTKKHQNARKRA